MAVEIRELVIKAVIVNEQDTGNGAGSPSAAEKEQLIQECVVQVLKIIRKSKNR